MPPTFGNQLERAAVDVDQTCIRRLGRHDVQLFQEHFLRLDSADRHRRFLGGVSEEFVKRYAAKTLGGCALLLGYFENGHLIGVGELHAATDDRSVGEVAFSVEASRRGRGLAQTLFGRLISAARRAGLRTIRSHCHPDNEPMKRLARSNGLTLGFRDGVTFGSLQLVSPGSIVCPAECLNAAIDIAA